MDGILPPENEAEAWRGSVSGDSEYLLIQPGLKLALLLDLLALRTNEFSFMFKLHLSQIISHLR